MTRRFQLASTHNIESLYIWLSPVPVVLTIVIPAACNIIFDFAPDLRGPNLLITRIGVALSVVLLITGIYFWLRRRWGKQGNARLRIALATLLAGFPAAIFLVVYLVWRA